MKPYIVHEIFYTVVPVSWRMQPRQNFKSTQKFVAGKALEVCVEQVAVEGIGDVSPVHDVAEQEPQILPRHAVVTTLDVVHCDVRTSIKITQIEWVHLVPACLMVIHMVSND